MSSGRNGAIRQTGPSFIVPVCCSYGRKERDGAIRGPDSKPAGLLRELGVSQASAIVVGTIIGSGIFLVPAEMMQAVGSARLVYLAWIVGGLLSLGGRDYLRRTGRDEAAGRRRIRLHPRRLRSAAAFLYAWTWFIIAKPGSIATIATGIVRILGTFPALAFFSQPAIRAPFVVTYGQLVAIAAAVLITWLNYIGVKQAGEFQLVFTILKVVMIVGVGVVGFTAASGTWKNFGTHYAGATGGIAGFMAALVAALWAYDGWNDLNMVSGEIRQPERTIPIALIAGVGMVAVLYMLNNAAVQYVLPASQIAAAAAAVVGGNSDCRGRLGRGHRLAGHGAVDAGRTQRHHHERRAHSVRRGARWILLQGHGRCASALSYAFGRAHRAAGAVDRPAVVRRKLPPACSRSPSSPSGCST